MPEDNKNKELLQKVIDLLDDEINDYQIELAEIATTISKFEEYKNVELKKYYTIEEYGDKDHYKKFKSICEDIDYDFKSDFWSNAFKEFYYEDDPHKLKEAIEGKDFIKDGEHRHSYGVVGRIVTQINKLRKESFYLTERLNSNKSVIIDAAGLINESPIKDKYAFRKLLYTIYNLNSNELSDDDKKKLFEFISRYNYELTSKITRHQKREYENNSILRESEQEETPETDQLEVEKEKSGVEIFKEKNAETINKIEQEIQKIKQEIETIKNSNPEFENSYQKLMTIVVKDNPEYETSFLKSDEGIIYLYDKTKEAGFDIRIDYFLKCLQYEDIKDIYDSFIISKSTSNMKDSLMQLDKLISYYKNTNTQDYIDQIISKHILEQIDERNADFINDIEDEISDLELEVNQFQNLHSYEFSNINVIRLTFNEATARKYENLKDLCSNEGIEKFKEIVSFHFPNIDPLAIIRIIIYKELVDNYELFDSSETVIDKNIFLNDLAEDMSCLDKVKSLEETKEQEYDYQQNGLIFMPITPNETYAGNYLNDDKHTIIDRDRQNIKNVCDYFRRAGSEFFTPKTIKKSTKVKDMKVSGLDASDIRKIPRGNYRYVLVDMKVLVPELNKYFTDEKKDFYLVINIGFKLGDIDVYDSTKSKKCRDAITSFRELVRNKLQEIEANPNIKNKSIEVLNYLQSMDDTSSRIFYDELGIEKINDKTSKKGEN